MHWMFLAIRGPSSVSYVFVHWVLPFLLSIYRPLFISDIDYMHCKYLLRLHLEFPFCLWHPLFSET